MGDEQGGHAFQACLLVTSEHATIVYCTFTLNLLFETGRADVIVVILQKRKLAQSDFPKVTQQR